MAMISNEDYDGGGGSARWKEGKTKKPRKQTPKREAIFNLLEFHVHWVASDLRTGLIIDNVISRVLYSLLI